MPTRVLLLSWEYPPIVEGGLARHVRKLAEELVRDGVEVHVLTRGGGRLAAVEDRHGVTVHRVREPAFPKDDLEAFVRWVDAMNDDMRAAGAALGDTLSLRPRPLARLAGGGRGAQARAALRLPVARDRARDRVRPPPGLGRQAPAAPHPRRRAADGARGRRRHHLLALHARPRRRGVRDRRGARHGGPQRHRPRRPAAGRRPAAAARAATRRRTSGSCCWSGGSSTRRASTSRSTRSRA